MKKLLILLFLPFFTQAQNLTGDVWRLEFQSPGGQLPLHFLIDQTDGDLKVYSLNADEKFEFDRYQKQGDTLRLFVDLYDLEFVFIPQGKNNAVGFMNKRGSDMMYRQIPFTATKGDFSRFKSPKKATTKPAPKYEVTFVSEGSDKQRPAIGLFETDKDNKVTGTFITRSGDYRYLEGNVVGDSLYLSTLSTSPVLYKAKIEGDSLIGGELFTPFELSARFRGKSNPDFSLDDASKRTYLKEGFTDFDFTFKDMFGEDVSLKDGRFNDKVTVVQILGTWCPNCLDETKFLMEYREKHPNLAVVGLAFERSDEPNYAWPKIIRFIQRFNIDYPVLLAGTTQNVNEKLPQLNHIMAFPTSIIVDKKGVVRKIQTGFSGPGSGQYYDDYVKAFEAFIAELESE